MIYLKENIDFNTEMKEIMSRGLNFGAEIRKMVSPSFVSDIKRKYSIDDLIELVPDMFFAVYDEEKAKQEWKKIAELTYAAASSGLAADILGTLRDIMDMYEMQLKTMYKGKDGKDYTSFEQVRSVDEFYAQQENPTMEHGRSR